MNRRNSVKTLLGALIVSAAALGLTAPVYAGDKHGHRYDDGYSHHSSHKGHSYKGHKRSKHGHDRHHYRSRHHRKHDRGHYGHNDRYCRQAHYPRQTYYDNSRNAWDYDNSRNAWDFIVRYHFDD